MPGLFGIIGKDKTNIEKVKIMRKTMMYESFYNSSIYTEHDLGIYMGWTCHNNSFCDCLPIFSDDKNVILFFSGENFTDLDQLDKLELNRKNFHKAKYIINLYEKYNEEFLNELNGWFHGVLIDKINQNIYLFNDIYGMQRIYFHEDGGSFIFSSEAKAILKIKNALKKVNHNSIAEWFCCDCVLENKTLYDKINILPGGSLWKFNNGSLKKIKYFSPVQFENKPKINDEQFYFELQRLFKNSLPKYLLPADRLSMSITGGLDTRMILSNIDMNHRQIPFYTFSGMYHENYDAKIARKIADKLEQKLTIIKVNKEFLDQFPEYLEKTVHISDGNMDVSGVVDLYVNKKVRQIADIRLTGNHGSELFRNFRFLKAIIPNMSLFNADFHPYIKQALQTYKKYSSIHSITFSIFFEAPWYAYNRHSVEQSQLTLRSPYMDKAIVELFYSANNKLRENKQLSLQLIQDGNLELSKINTDRGLNIHHKKLLSTFLKYFFEGSFKFEYLYNYGMPQWYAKFDYLTKYLHFERYFLGRHKFHHFRIWYRDVLASYVKEILLDKQTLSRPIWNSKYIEHIVTTHIKGINNFTTEISKLLVMELMYRQFIDN